MSYGKPNLCLARIPFRCVISLIPNTPHLRKSPPDNLGSEAWGLGFNFPLAQKLTDVCLGDCHLLSKRSTFG
jgi:hypothetical protein